MSRPHRPSKLAHELRRPLVEPLQPFANQSQDVAVEARPTEATGWNGIYLADYFMPDAEDTSGPTQECWTALAALAAVTSRVRLRSLVTGNTYRHPAVLAKMAAQVDIISGGRLVLGLGAGWQQNEHEAYGIEYHTVGGRMRRLEESAQILKSLFSNEQTTFEGRAYSLRNAPLAPKPVRPGGPPLLIGGGGEQRTLRIAAQYADEWNVWGARNAGEEGRDPRSPLRGSRPRPRDHPSERPGARDDCCGGRSPPARSRYRRHSRTDQSV